MNSIDWLIDADSFNNELMDRVKKSDRKDYLGEIIICYPTRDTNVTSQACVAAKCCLHVRYVNK